MRSLVGWLVGCLWFEVGFRKSGIGRDGNNGRKYRRDGGEDDNGKN